MIECAIYQRVKKAPLTHAQIQSAVETVCRSLKYSHATVSVHCVGFDRMRTLNRVHRGLDRPTDVLSFSALEGPLVGHEKIKEIGDIFLCIPYLVRQAKRVGVSAHEECVRMLVHGMLHAVGYDHMTAAEAKKMFPFQEKIVERIV